MTAWIPAVFVVSCLLAGPAASGEVQPPDPRLGVVDGTMAISVWPLGPDGEEMLAPGPFRAILVGLDDPDWQQEVPVGEWFVPPDGRYKVWIEGDGKMSPAPMPFSFRAEPFHGKGRVLALPVVPAGTVRLAESVAAPPGQTLRLLHLANMRDGHLQAETTRRVRGEARYSGVPMPAGSVVAGLYDEAAGEYVALAAPVKVRSGRLAKVTPLPPARGRAQVVVVLERPAFVVDPVAGSVDVQLRIGDDSFVPDVLVPLYNRAYALWLDVPAGVATVTASSSHSELPPSEMQLRSGRVERARLQLREKPDLEVSVVLPEGVEGRPVLTVEPADGRRQVASQTLSTLVEVYRIQDLARGHYRVTLRAGPWSFSKAADLRDGQDAVVVFAPRPLHVYGTVYRGGEAVEASLSFTLGRERGDRLLVTTDVDGGYETVVFRAGRYPVSVAVADSHQEPFFTLTEPVRASGRLDFLLPANRFVIETREQGSGEPLEGVRVGLTSRPQHGLAKSVHSVTTDAEGRAYPPPLRPGTLNLQADADGYRPARLGPLEIEEDDVGRTLPIFLEPIGATVEIRLQVAPGEPVIGGDVAVLATKQPLRILWMGGSDGEGRLSVPADLAGHWAAFRHPDFALDLRRLPVPQSEDEPPSFTWTMRRPGPPLLIVSLDGEDRPAPWTPVEVWLEDLRLPPNLLAWLTWSTGATDGRGRLRIGNLPPDREASVSIHIPDRLGGSAAAGPRGTVTSGRQPTRIVLRRR